MLANTKDEADVTDETAAGVSHAHNLSDVLDNEAAASPGKMNDDWWGNSRLSN